MTGSNAVARWPRYGATAHAAIGRVLCPGYARADDIAGHTLVKWSFNGDPGSKARVWLVPGVIPRPGRRYVSLQRPYSPDITPQAIPMSGVSRGERYVTR